MKKVDNSEEKTKKISLKQKRQVVLETYEKYKEEFEAGIENFDTSLLKHKDYLDTVYEMVDRALDDFLILARKKMNEN